MENFDCNTWKSGMLLNTFGVEQYVCHFVDIFKYIFFKENLFILIQISLKFVIKHLINNQIMALFQVMALCKTGSKPLPGLILANVYDAIWHH